MSAKLLIVDGYPDTLPVYKELYELQGYEVLTASSADAALLSVHHHHPALIIVVDDPGGVGGGDLMGKARRVAQKLGLHPLIGIAMRADFFPGDKPVTNFDHAVSKPPDLVQLDALVKRYLAQADEPG